MHATPPAALVKAVDLYSLLGEGGEEDAVEVAVVAEAVEEDAAGFGRGDGGRWVPCFRVEVEAVGSGEGAFGCGDGGQHFCGAIGEM